MAVPELIPSPLMPIVHWPTFSQQLVAREDEKSETWRAFLLSLGTCLGRISTQGLTDSDILDHPATSISPYVPPGEGTTKATSAMPYRIEEIAKPAVCRSLFGGRVDLVVSWRPFSGIIPADRTVVITYTLVPWVDRMLRMWYWPRRSEWRRS